MIARKPAPAGKPTVLLYAHHDVQPEGARENWATEPFEPTERDGRLFGRGAADDKAGIAAHLAAVRAHGDDLPVGVTIFVEGEEESGSVSLPAILEQHHDELASDVMVIADSTNWDIGVPALTTSLRGLAALVVEVRTLDHAVHSGMWGGVAPDALTSLIQLLATLHDADGNVAVDGLVSGPASDLDYPEDRLRAEAGFLDGVREIGSGSVVERLWTKPAISVIALDATRVADASNTLLPVARAAVSMRVAPGDDAARALGKLKEHLTSACAVRCAGLVRRRGHGSAVRDRRAGTGVRRSPGRVHGGVGRHRAGGHRGRRFDPVHRGVRRALPGRRDPGHRRRGSGHPGPRGERGAPPRRVRPGLPGRGPPAPQSRPLTGRRELRERLPITSGVST